MRLAWTADADLSMWAVIIVDVWKTVPFVTLLMLAALQMLPSDCYEAARVDGIHPLKVFWRVTLPLLMPALLVAAIFRILDSLRVFDVIYVLTSNSSSTMSMSVYARQHLVEFRTLATAARLRRCCSWWLRSSPCFTCTSDVVNWRCAHEPAPTEKTLLRLGFWCLIGILLLYAVFPFYYAIVTSLKPSSALFEVSYWIKNPDFSNYSAVLHQASFLQAIGNSLVVALCVVALALFLSLTAAYALGRVKFRGRGTVLMLVLGCRCFPRSRCCQGCSR